MRVLISGHKFWGVGTFKRGGEGYKVWSGIDRLMGRKRVTDYET